MWFLNVSRGIPLPCENFKGKNKPIETLWYLIYIYLFVSVVLSLNAF